MKVIVAIEHRFSRTPDGDVWTQSPFFYPFWQRYLEVFEHVSVVARVQNVSSVSAQWRQANGEGVTFIPVPYYVGPWQYLCKSQQVKQVIRQSVTSEDAVIMRVSSQIADCLEPLLRQLGHPYGLEVVADPYDAFAPGSIKNILRPIFRWWFPRRLRQQCQMACAISYVTEFALQQRYPPASRAWTTHYSSVELPETAFVTRSRTIHTKNSVRRLIMVGTLAQLYKAPDILIHAIARCIEKGLNLKLTIVGDGQHQSELEALATRMGISHHINFRGRLPAGVAVMRELDQADLFVLPSYQEGLPRAMIEAMARGLPCIGSTVGGIPELLQDSEMVPPGDAIALAEKIQEVLDDPQRMTEMSQRNLNRAQTYCNTKLSKKRTEFYQAIRQITTDWMAKQ